MNFRDKPFLDLIYPLVENHALEKAIAVCEAKLAGIPTTPFHKIIGRDLLPSSRKLATWLMDFYLEAFLKLRKVEAIYCEMNGFSINPDHWYINPFGFKSLREYQKGVWTKGKVYDADVFFTVTGFEDLQDVFVFACKHGDFRRQNEQAYYYCEYAIVLRLQQLFQAAYTLLDDYEVGRIPVFVTAHDYDLIYKTQQ
jgi:hypothetical protein